MLLRPAEFTHASEKFEFTTKEFGASRAERSLRRCVVAVARTTSSVGRRWPISSNVIGWRHAVEYGSLKLASLLFCYVAKPMI